MASRTQKVVLPPIETAHTILHPQPRAISSFCLLRNFPRVRVTAGLIALFLLVPSLARAQAIYGSLVGNVTDPSGAAVVGARITVTAAQTGVRQSTVADSSGIYRFPNLLPATYDVTITAAGFTTQETPGVQVSVGQIARVDFQLKVGTAAQTVTVTAAAPLLQTDTAQVQTQITSRQILNLPVMGTQGANFQELMRTVPGSGLTGETNSLAGNPQRAINENVNGLSYQSVSTRIDGVLDAYPYLPANVAYVPPADAIQTVSVVTNSFTAEQGMAGGAAVNVETKSGTNHFHGDIHEFHTDQNFAARNYFLTDPKIYPHKNRNNQNQYGGAVGGPVVRNKVFFFFDYERTTQRQLAGPDTRTLPTAAMAKGDFRNIPGNPVIYDPATGDATGANKSQVSCNGVANVICPGRIDPAAQAMITLLQTDIAKEFPTANDLGNWTGSGTALFNRNNGDAKVTWVPGQNSAIWGKYSFSKTLVYDPPLLGPAIGDATNGGQLGNAPGLVQLVGIGATHTFTPHLLFDWNAGYTRQRLGSTFDLNAPNGLNDLHIPGTNNAGTTGDPTLYYGYPGFQLGPNPSATNQVGPNLGNSQVANPFLFRDDQLVSDANLSWIKGRHNFKGGFEWSHTLINHFQPQGGTFQNARGQFQFNGDVTSQLGATPTWFNSWADFLLGLPSATGKAVQLSNPNPERWSVWAWYLQDQWQATSSLTLTFGVRWEYYPFGYGDNGKGLRYLDLQTGRVLIGGYGSVPRNDGVDTGYGQFLPRLGAAWRVTPTTVLRAGYGVSADPYIPWHEFLNSYPALLLDTNVPANTAYYIPAASLTGANGTGLGSGTYSVPSGIVLSPFPNLSSGSIPLPTNISTTTIPNPYHRGYFNSYNLTVEQEFGKDVALNLGYVGTYAVRPVVNMNANASAPGTGSAGGTLSQRYGANYTGTINELNPFKHSRYDSLQSSLRYIFAGGSNVTVAYTWSKTMNYASEEDLGSLLIPYLPEVQKDYAPAEFDRTNNVEISSVAALPFGKNQRWLRSGVGGAILGGWLFAPIVSVMSGAPFTVTASGNLASNGSTQTADLVGNYHRTHGRPPRSGVTCALGDPRCEYFAPNAFAAPWICTNPGAAKGQCGASSPAHFGNTNRDEFRGPGYFSAGLSIVRDFPVREWVTLELRGEAVNLTNTPHFGNPTNSCPGSPLTPGPVAGSGQLCSTGTNNNFGVITGVTAPGGYFGQDPGNRQLWLGATIEF